MTAQLAAETALETNRLPQSDCSTFAVEVVADHSAESLLRVLNSGWDRDGRPGLFNPDRFSFGQVLYLSPIVAAAREVPGVDSVSVTRFSRQGTDDPQPAEDGFMRFGRLEIPRLANNPSFPEHGVLRLDMVGGN